ncbi:MAG: carboxypeptidase-like regulatory domain-containing protein [Balneolales bacterium]
MRKYQVQLVFVLILTCAFTQLSCKENLMEAERYGEIHGVIQNDFDDKVVKGAGVTTNPPTVATSSDGSGRFKIKDVSPGNYTVQVKKKGYKGTSVNISVREEKTADALIFLNLDEEESSNSMAEIEITRWQNKSSNDSVYVDVNYRIDNVGDTDIQAYEIYFKIETESSIYYQEQQGEKLRSGQKSFGEFKKYMHSETAKKVIIDDHWLGSKEESSDED